MQNNRVYALDFDGVLCDSATELAHSAWKCCQTLWSDMVDVVLSETLVQQFRQIRPLLETGHESIMMMRLLHQGINVDDFYAAHEQLITTLVVQESLDLAYLKRYYSDVRDQWIRDDLSEWLSKSPLFEGIAEKLAKLADQTWYIVTTKQARFVQYILRSHGINIADECVFGLERQLSKQQVLQQLCGKHPQCSFVFVEDRLPTLLGVQDNPALKQVTLQLVDWGYNTVSDRLIAQQYGIAVIQLDDFLPFKRSLTVIDEP